MIKSAGCSMAGFCFGMTLLTACEQAPVETPEVVRPKMIPKRRWRIILAQLRLVVIMAPAERGLLGTLTSHSLTWSPKA